MVKQSSPCRQAVGEFGVTLRGLYRFIDAGDWPASKMGRVIRIRGSDLDRFR